MKQTLTFREFITILPSKYPLMKIWSCSRTCSRGHKFFPQYLDKELHITAQLFGGIIEHYLVTNVKLGLALRIVL